MSECAMVKQCTTGKKEKETQIKRLSLSTSPPYHKGKKKISFPYSAEYPNSFL